MSTPLTDQERHRLWEAGDHHPEMCDCAGDDWSAEGQWCTGLEDTFAAVESIVTARVAAERDRLLGKLEALADDTSRSIVIPTPDTKFSLTRVIRVRDLRALVAEERAT